MANMLMWTLTPSQPGLGGSPNGNWQVYLDGTTAKIVIDLSEALAAVPYANKIPVAPGVPLGSVGVAGTSIPASDIAMEGSVMTITLTTVPVAGQYTVSISMGF